MITLPILDPVIRSISSDEGCYHSVSGQGNNDVIYQRQSRTVFYNFSHDANVIGNPAPVSIIMMGISDYNKNTRQEMAFYILL